MSSRGGGDGAMTGRESSWRILSVLGGVMGVLLGTVAMP